MVRAKAVFFDLGETLVTQNIEDNLITRKSMRELSKILPKPVSAARLYEIYQKGYRANQAIRSRHHVEIIVQVWMPELLERALGEDPSESLVKRAIGIIVKNRAANSVAFNDARPVLERLKRRKARLGVISNVSSHEVAVEILKHVKLDKYFEDVFTSALTGIRKPDPGIFWYALKHWNLKPEETVHVGDSERHDVWGAKPMGITTVLVKQDEPNEPTDADYYFPSLKEASGLLEKLVS
jgi:HAD superfamily hydrolase (TIGR01509 family)